MDRNKERRQRNRKSRNDFPFMLSRGKIDLEGHYDLLIPKSSKLTTDKASKTLKKLIEKKFTKKNV